MPLPPSKLPTAIAAEWRAKNRLYHIDWRATGTVTIQGRANAAAALGISEASLGVYLSNGKAKKGLLRDNPQTGNPDVVTVTAPPAPKAPSSKPPKVKPPSGKRRGRPPKDRVNQEA